MKGERDNEFYKYAGKFTHPSTRLATTKLFKHASVMCAYIYMHMCRPCQQLQQLGLVELLELLVQQLVLVQLLVLVELLGVVVELLELLVELLELLVELLELLVELLVLLVELLELLVLVELPPVKTDKGQTQPPPLLL